jgi:predicted site-specific integrase-resolvase
MTARGPVGELHTIAWLADRLQVSTRQAKRLIASGDVQSVKVGARGVRTTEEWVQDYLRRRVSGGRGRKTA